MAEEEPVRIRVEFDDRKLLSSSRRSDGLSRAWILLRPEMSTIADVAGYVRRRFGLRRSCPDGLLITMDDFVLPPFESTCILKDNDIIRVRKKGASLINVKETDNNQHYIQDSGIVERQPIYSSPGILAIREFQEDPVGRQSKNDEDSYPQNENPVLIRTLSTENTNPKRKRKHSDTTPISNEFSEARTGTRELASTPPRGWNSYDSFSWVIDEQAFLDNAAILAKKLLPYGYEYVVVDYLWYRNNTEGASNQDAIGFDNIDRWGRPIPDPERWPSSGGGRGFKEVARKVHNMGLKFGIHVMRGISAEAVNANTPILDVLKGGAYVEDGRRKHAVDVGMANMSCAWLKGFMSVNTDSGAGEAFLRSLYHQYAEWGVDFVKLDCVFGDDMSSREIITVSKLLKELDRPVVFSLSPGSHASPSMAEAIVNYVNMYRVTGDDWDKWEDVAAHFDVARDFAAAKMIGAQGLNGRSWPDLDMLPLGWLTDPGVRQGPHRKCDLTQDEQKTQMTLWAMVKSPLMFGGDLRNIDRTTYGLITNRKLLDINSHSENNMEFPYVTAGKNIRRASRVYTRNVASVEQLYTSNNDVMGLTSCSNENAKGWFISHEGEKNQMCWEHRLKSNNISCLYKRRSEEITYKQEHQGKFQLLVAKTKDTCLDASVNRKRTASENTFLSICKWNANQMWELNDDGTLLSSYSGLCATVERKNSNSPKVIHGGVRSWVATGRRGEIYISFFNLESERTHISVEIGDLEKTLGRKFTGTGSCNCSEVWTGTHFGIVDKTLSTLVEPHGCSLFVLNCKT